MSRYAGTADLAGFLVGLGVTDELSANCDPCAAAYILTFGGSFAGATTGVSLALDEFDP